MNVLSMSQFFSNSLQVHGDGVNTGLGCVWQLIEALAESGVLAKLLIQQEKPQSTFTYMTAL